MIIYEDLGVQMFSPEKDVLFFFTANIVILAIQIGSWPPGDVDQNLG